jgi:ribosomal protein S18 acetylase RimI-like enzyme
MTRIVRANRRHIGSIVKLMTASPLLQRYGITARGPRAALAEAFRSRDNLLVAVEDEAIVGFAWVITTRALDHSAYLALLLVAESRQSRGIGAALLARAERDARASGSRHFVFLVTKANRRARSFYKRHGYSHVGDLPGFARPWIAETLYLKSWRT